MFEIRNMKLLNSNSPWNNYLIFLNDDESQISNCRIKKKNNKNKKTQKGLKNKKKQLKRLLSFYVTCSMMVLHYFFFVVVAVLFYCGERRKLTFIFFIFYMYATNQPFYELNRIFVDISKIIIMKIGNNK